HHLSYLMKREIAKCIDFLCQQLNELYSHTKKHFFLHCFSLLPTGDLEELQHGVRIMEHLTGLQFSFQKAEDWLHVLFFQSTIVPVLPSICDPVFWVRF